MSEENKPANLNDKFREMEEEVLSFWQKAKIFEQSVEKNAPNGEYIFYDGPPFITGLPHYGSLLPSIAKDVIPRYQTMKGKRVKRVWGWDCHGLPAENQVEKELNLKNKKDIEKLGVDKFTKACREYVSECSSQWKWYIDRIGRWVDMDNAYRTMDQEFMESELWAFKKMYDEGLIYEGYRNSLHCTRCATPISKFEITMDEGSYIDVTDKSVVVKFKVKNSDLYLLAWTTTPWTLPGNRALAVGLNITYLEVQCDGEKYIIAKERLEGIFEGKNYKIIKEMKGKDVIKYEYHSLFNDEDVYNVYPADFVSTEDGTGIVHIAPNFGEEDFNLGKKQNIPFEDLMDENGAYIKNNDEDWGGMHYKKAGEKVMDILQDRILIEFDVTHSYPHCHRCKEPLIYRTQKSWYVDIEKIRKLMLDLNKETNWIPGFFKEGRFKYNLENAPDWCISRTRYWGTPLPVWKCDACNKVEVLGSIKEIEEKSGQKVKDLHRPDIDEIKITCDVCSAEMNRIKEVFDSWFDSGSMPFAQFHYPFNKEVKDNWESFLPADFIIEYTGQLRGWFYSLHVMSVALFKSISFKNVIVTGVLAGNDGRKMSKSLKNYPDPKMTIEKYGSDALRMYFMNNNIMIGEDLSISETDIQEAMRKNVVLLWNIFEFYNLFAKEHKFIEKEPSVNNVLDNWILSKLNQLIIEVTENLDNYNLPLSSRPITLFIDDFSTWYVRRSRDRFKGDDVEDKESALKTMNYVLLSLSQLMAPFAPFIAEQVWQKITGNSFKNNKRSVHLEKWPVAGSVDNEVLEKMRIIREMVSLGLTARSENNVKIRQPLAKMTIKGKDIDKQFTNKDDYISLIKDEVNVKSIDIVSGKGDYAVELDMKMTPELKEEGIKREIIRFINNLRKKSNLTIEDKVDIYFETDSSIGREAINNHIESIKKETICANITEIKQSSGDITGTLKIEEKELNIFIKKL